MKLFEIESVRPGLVAACAPAHDTLVGFLGVSSAPTNRPRLAPIQVHLMQEESVQFYGSQSRPVGINQVQQQGINGSKAIGMAAASVTTDADVRGVPPRGRPV